MSYLKYSRNAIAFLALVPSVLLGQRAQGTDIPLKNWAAPLYWQPNQAERAASGKSGAQFQIASDATSTDSLVFVAISPCRLVDTRGAGGGFVGSSPFSGPYIQAQTYVSFPIQSATEANTSAPTPCGTIPNIAQAYSLNLTVVPHPFGNSVNFVTIWPNSPGVSQPSVSTINDQQGAILANAAIVPAGTTSGGINVYAYGATDVIIDLNGYYAAPTDLNSNTAVGGYNFISGSFSGQYNSAFGQGAMQNLTTGSQNVAVGYDAMAHEINGLANTAVGFQAMYDATSGGANTALGYLALQNITVGSSNTAMGAVALNNDSTGDNNTAVGPGALQFDTVGNDNIGIGLQAGVNIATGSDNIMIGNPGLSTDTGIIRIGSLTANTNCSPTCNPQSAFFAAGIAGVNVTSGVNVVVNSSGQLGIVASSRRFKEDIQDMGDASSDLLRLHPVTFHYKEAYAGGSKSTEYGLIAEEVEKVYPDLVVHSADGQIETVKYQVLDSMLLNEVQKQAEKNRLQAEENRQQARQIRSLEERLAALEQLLTAGSEPAH